MIRLREHIAVLAAVLLSAAAFAQYPAGTNKIRLGAQTSGDGLVFRGVVGDTVTVKPTTANNAYFLLDTLSGTLYRYIKSRQGWQPVSAAAPAIILDGEVNGATNATTVDTVRRIWFDRTYTAPDALGKLQWNANEGTLNLGVGFDGVVLQLGQETFYPNVINKTGSLIKNGTVVMVDPVTPVQGDHIRVVPANGSGIYPSKLVMGVLTQDLPFDSLGLVTWFGFVREVKESDIVQTGITLAVGDVLYLSATQPGKVTNVEPTAPAIKVAVALLVRKPNANNLTLLVRPWLNEDLKELNDVRQDVGVQNQVIRYDLATGVWTASTTAGIVAGDTASMLSTYLRPSEILAGTGITLSKDSTVTISAPTTLSSSTAIIDVAEVVVDNLTALRLPWDGTAVVGVIKTGLYLTSGVNEAFVQHELIPNGDKGDITTSAGGAVMTIDTGAVSLAKLSSGVRDTLAGKLNIGDTLTMLSTYINREDTAAMLIPYINREDTAAMLTNYVNFEDTLTTIGTKANLNLKLNAADTASLSTRIDAKQNTITGAATSITAANLTASRALVSDGSGKVAASTVTATELGYLAGVTGTTGSGNLVLATSPTISGATITTGSINNTPIGATTANTGAFTTLTASSTLTVTGAGSIQGLTIGRGNNAFSTNTALGASTLTATQTGGVSGGGQNNTAVGYRAMQFATSSQLNTAVGANALQNLTNAIGVNTAVGYNALLNTNASSNTAMGYRVMETNASGEENAAFGYEALFDNTSGQDNAAFGFRALENNTTGSNNTALGYQTLTNNTTGSNNIGIGRFAGQSSTNSTIGNTTGNHNIYIGVNAVGNANNNWNEIVIGSGAVGIGRNSVTLGNDTIATTLLRGRVGIRQSAPQQALHVRGKVRADTLNSTPLFIAGIGTDSTLVRLSTDSLPSIAELKHVKGVTSAIQTQLNTKLNATDTASLSNRINAFPVTYEYTTVITDSLVNIPSGCKTIEIVCIGGGGGGGSGRRGVASGQTVATGGTGGSGAAYSFISLDASAITAQLKITVGAGGTGGAARTTNDTNGENGTNGKASSVYTGATGSPANALLIYAGGGGAGEGGQSPGLGLDSLGERHYGDFSGKTGGYGDGQNADVFTGIAVVTKASGGGGGGGRITAGTTENNGGNGGAAGYAKITSTNRGTTATPNATAGYTPVAGQSFGGGGGGGGASKTSGAGGNGGNGVRGGGGGGGGASVNGVNSGAGGNGGAGYVRITFY